MRMDISREIAGNSPNTFSRKQRTFTRSVLSTCSLVVLAGCAIHPVQKDVTGFRTVDIVDRIRCESRLAVQDKAIAMLLKHAEETKNPRSMEIAEGLARHRGDAWNFDPKVLDVKERKFYDHYIETGIAYEFTFDISEENKSVATVDPLRLITGGTVGVAVGQTNDLTRHSIRRFSLSESFDDVLKNTKLPCQNSDQPSNYAYPMAGSVGMQELIDTFIDLNQDKDLAKLDKDAAPRVFADTIEFTTVVSGSIQPHIEISAVGKRWGLKSPTNIEASAKRSDIHKLVVGLSMEALTKKPTPRAPAAALAPQLTRPRASTSDAKKANENKALDAIQQQHIYDFYDRFSAPVR